MICGSWKVSRFVITIVFAKVKVSRAECQASALVFKRVTRKVQCNHLKHSLILAFTVVNEFHGFTSSILVSWPTANFLQNSPKLFCDLDTTYP